MPAQQDDARSGAAGRRGAARRRSRCGCRSRARGSRRATGSGWRRWRRRSPGRPATAADRMQQPRRTRRRRAPSAAARSTRSRFQSVGHPPRELLAHARAGTAAVRPAARAAVTPGRSRADDRHEVAGPVARRCRADRAPAAPRSASAATGDRTPAGITPTTSRDRPSTTIDRPTTPGSAPKRVRHSASLRSTTRVARRLILAGAEDAAERRRDAEDAEQLGGHARAGDAHRRAVAGQREHVAVGVGGDVHRRQRAPRRGQPAAGIHGVGGHQPFRRRIRQPRHEDAVDEREDRGGGADAERERQDGGHGDRPAGAAAIARRSADP